MYMEVSGRLAWDSVEVYDRDVDELLPYAAILVGTYIVMLLWLRDNARYTAAIDAAFAQTRLLPVAAAIWLVGTMLRRGAHLLRPVSPRAQYYLYRYHYQGRHFA